MSENDQILFLQEWRNIWSFLNRLKKIKLKQCNYLNEEEKEIIKKFKDSVFNLPFNKLWEQNNAK